MTTEPTTEDPKPRGSAALPPEAIESEVRDYCADVWKRIQRSRVGVRTWRKPRPRSSAALPPDAHLRGCPPERD